MYLKWNSKIKSVTYIVSIGGSSFVDKDVCMGYILLLFFFFNHVNNEYVKSIWRLTESCIIWQVNRKDGTRLSALGETFYTEKKYNLHKISTFIKKKIWKMYLFHGIKADSFIWIHVYCIYRFKHMFSCIKQCEL